MAQTTVLFPAHLEFTGMDMHTFNQGGMHMKVKHTHPNYESQETRLEQLKDTQKSCLALIRMLRNLPEKSA